MTPRHARVVSRSCRLSLDWTRITAWLKSSPKWRFTRHQQRETLLALFTRSSGFTKRTRRQLSTSLLLFYFYYMPEWHWIVISDKAISALHPHPSCSPVATLFAWPYHRDRAISLFVWFFAAGLAHVKPSRALDHCNVNLSDASRRGLSITSNILADCLAKFILDKIMLSWAAEKTRRVRFNDAEPDGGHARIRCGRHLRVVSTDLFEWWPGLSIARRILTIERGHILRGYS